MRKKMTALTGITFLMTLMLVGCGDSDGVDSEGGEGNEKTTINVILPADSGTEEALDGIIESYEEENSGIKVNAEFVEYDSLKQKILTSSQTGDYDITMVDQPWVAQFANANILQKAPESLSGEEEKDIFSSFVDGMSFNGNMYAMPWKNDTKFLYYNKAMLEEAGFDNPPETWDELREQSEEIKKQGLADSPVVWSWSQSEALVCDFVAITGGYGDEVIVDGKPNFESDGSMEALSFMSNSLEDGLSNSNSTEYSEQDVQDSFLNENAAFALNWTFMYSAAKDSDIGDDFGVTLVPGSEEVKSASVYGGEGLGITSGSKNPDEAWDFIKYVTSKEVQKENTDITLPIWHSLYSDEEVLEDNSELVKVASEQFDYMNSRPKIPSYGDLSKSMQTEIQEVLTGNKSPEKGLTDLQNEATEIMEDN